VSAGIISQPQEAMGNFVREHLGLNEGSRWGEYRTLGLVRNSALAGAVVYNHFSQYSCCAHIAGLPGKMWMTPEFLYAIFDYPFNGMKLQRITGLVPERNERAAKFDEHLGFKYEGKMRNALPDGEGLLVYGMLKEECRWISEEFSTKVYKRLMMRYGSSSSTLH